MNLPTLLLIFFLTNPIAKDWQGVIGVGGAEAVDPMFPTNPITKDRQGIYGKTRVPFCAYCVSN